MPWLHKIRRPHRQIFPFCLQTWSMNRELCYICFIGRLAYNWTNTLQFLSVCWIFCDYIIVYDCLLKCSLFSVYSGKQISNTQRICEGCGRSVVIVATPTNNLCMWHSLHICPPLEHQRESNCWGSLGRVQWVFRPSRWNSGAKTGK